MSESEGSATRPAATRGPRLRRLPLMLAGAIVLALLVVVGVYHFDLVTESDEFCGLLCHPIRPQYVSHAASPHANVSCGACHVGPGLAPKVEAKILGLRELFSLITQRYDRPITASIGRLRLAREICQQCHSSEASEGLLRRSSRFGDDERNPETVTSLLLRTGSSEKHPQAEPGIHWHVEHPVWFVSSDPNRQEIPWVRATRPDGKLVEFQATDISAAQVGALPRRQMDCYDCHNRSGHDFQNPADSVGAALASGLIDPRLPYVKREAVKLLTASYPTQQAGSLAMDALEEFFRSQAPIVYAARKQSGAQAVAVVREIYTRTVFPDMRVTWDSYDNNIGHRHSLGCFRCHDGKHASASGEVIPFRCSLCHTLPVVARVGQQSASPPGGAALAAGAEEPESHAAPYFIRDHRIQASDACASCHGAIRYGADDSGFCANQACHGTRWSGLDLEARYPHLFPLPGGHSDVPCNECHRGVARPPRDDCAACHQPPSEPHFGTGCARCHTVVGWEQIAPEVLSGASAIPHRLDPAYECAPCHGKGGAKPAPASHQGFAPDACLLCHKPAGPANVPTIPHTLEDRSACLTCHAEGGRVPAPADHRRRI